MSTGPVHRIHLRSVVAYPAVTVALVVSVALALTPFGPSRVMALNAAATPTETTTTSTTPSTTPSTTTSTTTTTTTTSTTTTTTPTPSPSSGVVAAAGDVPVDHHVLARIEGADFQANYLAVNAKVADASQFQTFRVRFKMHNAGTAPISVTPQLEYRVAGDTGYIVVPENPLNGIPFHIAREWVPSLGPGGGTMQGPLSENIPVSDLRIGKESAFAVNGHHSMGANPDLAITLPSASYTEQEFTISLTMDAKYLTGYELRITDGRTVLAGTKVAEIRLGAPPALALSPGQHQGLAVVGPKKTSNPTSGTGVAK